jgi:hypothetical protein
MMQERKEKPKSVFGVVSLILMALSNVVPFVDPGIDYSLRFVIPFTGLALAVVAFFRRERAIWPIIGFLLVVFYVGVRLIPAD